ncbi:MAG TPA: bifunctional precorrin-2 dehydrogenase/sirohydrochlorin ferrochelatase [Candidatus Saccharimonadales bacterium]|nr:bifunctional precorrin-2 dehydrogenase/sirohydrochlorin ferrochelatase [Candidatus Saccharimonadales bacterium]
MANLFPLFLKLDGRKCVVVGGGKIAESKLDLLLSSGANVEVVAPEATERIRNLDRAGRLRWAPYCFAPKDLDGALLTIAATGSTAVNEKVFLAATDRGVLCNAVDDPERCDFYYPAVVHRGDLQIAISTSGKSPALAQRIRIELEQRFDEGYGEWLSWLGSVRDLFFRRPIDPERRRLALHKIAGSGVYERFRSSRQRRRQGASHG